MGCQLIPFHHPQRAYGRTEYADVTTKFSRVDSLPNFLTHGAPLERASRARAPLKITKKTDLILGCWKVWVGYISGVRT